MITSIPIKYQYFMHNYVVQSNYFYQIIIIWLYGFKYFYQTPICKQLYAFKLQGGIREMRINYFARKQIERWFNWNLLDHWINEKSVHQWSGRQGFNPRSNQTKDSKNGTWCHLA